MCLPTPCRPRLTAQQTQGALRKGKTLSRLREEAQRGPHPALPSKPAGWTQPLPVSMDRVVVFPAPLCPKRTVICPSYMFTVKSLTASFTLFPTLKTCRDHVTELMLHSGRVLLDLRPPGSPSL